MLVKGEDLKLGDVVRLHDSEYSDATVKAINEDNIYFFRPYVATEDFSCATRNGLGVICYVGIEEFSVSKKQDFMRVRKGPELK